MKKDPVAFREQISQTLQRLREFNGNPLNKNAKKIFILYGEDHLSERDNLESMIKEKSLSNVFIFGNGARNFSRSDLSIISREFDENSIISINAHGAMLRNGFSLQLMQDDEDWQITNIFSTISQGKDYPLNIMINSCQSLFSVSYTSSLPEGSRVIATSDFSNILSRIDHTSTLKLVEYLSLSTIETKGPFTARDLTLILMFKTVNTSSISTSSLGKENISSESFFYNLSKISHFYEPIGPILVNFSLNDESLYGKSDKELIRIFKEKFYFYIYLPLHIQEEIRLGDSASPKVDIEELFDESLISDAVQQFKILTLHKCIIKKTSTFPDFELNHELLEKQMSSMIYDTLLIAIVASKRYDLLIKFLDAGVIVNKYILSKINNDPIHSRELEGFVKTILDYYKSNIVENADKFISELELFLRSGEYCNPNFLNFILKEIIENNFVKTQEFCDHILELLSSRTTFTYGEVEKKICYDVIKELTVKSKFFINFENIKIQKYDIKFCKALSNLINEGENIIIVINQKFEEIIFKYSDQESSETLFNYYLEHKDPSFRMDISRYITNIINPKDIRIGFIYKYLDSCEKITADEYYEIAHSYQISLEKKFELIKKLDLETINDDNISKIMKLSIFMIYRPEYTKIKEDFEEKILLHESQKLFGRYVKTDLQQKDRASEEIVELSGISAEIIADSSSDY